MNTAVISSFVHVRSCSAVYLHVAATHVSRDGVLSSKTCMSQMKTLLRQQVFFLPDLYVLTVLPLRKACVTCGCSAFDHAPGNDQEDDQRMGRLLTDSPYAHLTAKVKGGGGLRVYKRNRMIVTNPVVSRKDPTFNTTTYDWAPAGINQTLVRILIRPNLLA